MGPGGPAPTRKGARVLRHRGVGSPPTGGVYAIGGGTRGSGKRAEAQRSASNGVARSRALGWRPAPEINKNTVCETSSKGPVEFENLTIPKPHLLVTRSKHAEHKKSKRILMYDGHSKFFLETFHQFTPLRFNIKVCLKTFSNKISNKRECG